MGYVQDKAQSAFDVNGKDNNFNKSRECIYVLQWNKSKRAKFLRSKSEILREKTLNHWEVKIV